MSLERITFWFGAPLAAAFTGPTRPALAAWMAGARGLYVLTSSWTNLMLGGRSRFRGEGLLKGDVPRRDLGDAAEPFDWKELSEPLDFAEQWLITESSSELSALKASDRARRRTLLCLELGSFRGTAVAGGSAAMGGIRDPRLPRVGELPPSP